MVKQNSKRHWRVGIASFADDDLKDLRPENWCIRHPDSAVCRWQQTSNCILYAIQLYMRRKIYFARMGKKHAGYVVIRRSRYGPFPHVIYVEKREYGLRWISYVPDKPSARRVPPLFFFGHVRWGDG